MIKLLKEVPGKLSILCIEEIDKKGVSGCHQCCIHRLSPVPAQAVLWPLLGPWEPKVTDVARKEPTGDWKLIVLFR